MKPLTEPKETPAHRVSTLLDNILGPLAGSFLAEGGEDHIKVYNPATGEILSRVGVSTDHEVEESLRAVDRGSLEWAAKSDAERGTILVEAANLIRGRVGEMATILTLEQGKTFSEATSELERTAAIFEHCGEAIMPVEETRKSELPETLCRESVIQVPVGPVAAFSPWNYPALTPGRKLAEALAAGCSIVLKPAEETPLTAMGLAKACYDAGVPVDTVQLLFGRPAELSEKLIHSPVTKMLSFTGSIPVGRALARMAGEALMPALLELGGNAPVVIFDDVDVIRIARAAVRAKFRNAGQICVAPSRFFVQEAVYEAFLEAFIQAASELNVGNGLNPAVDMGPVATERRVQAMEDYLRRAEEAGATVAYRGDTPEARGAYSPPTVLTGLPRGSEVWQEEVFGPIAPIASFDTLETAIELSNSVTQGLAAYVFSGDEKIASAVAQKVHAGMIAVNSFDSSTVKSPFGGVGESGYGREGGVYGIAAYQTLKYLNER